MAGAVKAIDALGRVIGSGAGQLRYFELLRHGGRLRPGVTGDAFYELAKDSNERGPLGFGIKILGVIRGK
ncbi:hypothetical protein [Bradyrhizobium sp. CCBAU 11386]|uniref:hypothetical protein n=1 Tax=Bradyrhizobium sp. CCBAU 11386 TaxID=1630837 RepID=UPI002303DA07|nr:hypothetical protein [Bradyrhizobium sp. CCBAU 11386]